MSLYPTLSLSENIVIFMPNCLICCWSASELWVLGQLFFPGPLSCCQMIFYGMWHFTISLKKETWVRFSKGIYMVAFMIDLYTIIKVWGIFVNSEVLYDNSFIIDHILTQSLSYMEQIDFQFYLLITYFCWYTHKYSFWIPLKSSDKIIKLQC